MGTWSSATSLSLPGSLCFSTLLCHAHHPHQVGSCRVQSRAPDAHLTPHTSLLVQTPPLSSDVLYRVNCSSQKKCTWPVAQRASQQAEEGLTSETAPHKQVQAELKEVTQQLFNLPPGFRCPYFHIFELFFSNKKATNSFLK